MTTTAAPSVDDPAAACAAGRDWLSLALIDSRNRTLRWLEAFESADHLDAADEATGPVLRAIGQAGWLQEFWIARHVQRARGEAADAAALRLPACEPQADDWFDAARGRPWRPATAPSADTVRRYLATTLETTLDLLHGTPDADAPLFVFRLALLAEDRLAERLAEAADARGLAVDEAACPGGAPVLRAEREPLWLPASRFSVGSPRRPGLVPPNERWAHEVAVPDFEIDAQPVTWRRFVEFAEDGGYDRQDLWSPPGWAWLQAEGRRAPRHVEQLRGGVLLQRGGAVRRAAAGEAVVHASWYEADAWCRWAGRRLPTEVEWELAAATATSRGFVWGEVWEWAAGSARAWPNDGAVLPAAFSPVPPSTPLRVLRGASSWTVRRLVRPQVRRFRAATRDGAFCGFRSCAF